MFVDAASGQEINFTVVDCLASIFKLLVQTISNANLLLVLDVSDQMRWFYQDVLIFVHARKSPKLKLVLKDQAKLTIENHVFEVWLLEISCHFQSVNLVSNFISDHDSMF